METAPAEVFRLSVRTRRISCFGRRLAWCCGVLASKAGSLEEGDAVSVCLQAGETQGISDNMRDFVQHISKQQGGDKNGRPSMLLVQLACERREAGPVNYSGAVTLHAVAFLGFSTFSPPDSDDEFDDPDLHREDKSSRHAVFASWLLETFGQELLASGTGLLEVGAGKGQLIRELRSQLGSRALSCTLVEPALRSSNQLDAEAGTVWLQEAFNEATFPAAHPELLRDCSVLVGLHPDQATEAIVEVALRLKKPFAIVPCCVYPRLFPDRRTVSGQGVTTYRGFCQYLKAKDTRTRSSKLSFQGRNKVLYIPEYSAS